MQVKAWIALEPALYPSSLVSGIIVNDQVQIEMGRAPLVDGLEEAVAFSPPRVFPGHNIGKAPWGGSNGAILNSIAMSLVGQERRYRPRPPTVRCSTDSGRIAAPPRTGAWGQFPKFTSKHLHPVRQSHTANRAFAVTLGALRYWGCTMPNDILRALIALAVIVIAGAAWAQETGRRGLLCGQR
jgi:hypothetical protein